MRPSKALLQPIGSGSADLITNKAVNAEGVHTLLKRHGFKGEL